jgi:hypothetical protein
MNPHEDAAGRDPAAAPPVRPAPHSPPRPPNLAGIAAVATAGLVAVIITIGIFLPALGALGDAITSGPGALPARITACGRDWAKDPLSRELTQAEVYERTGDAPILVEVALIVACPPEVDAAPAADPVTQVFVQTGPDRYVPYSLVTP